MKNNERLETFLKLQDKKMEFEDISVKMEIKPQTLRSFLNRKGYKKIDGKYIIKKDDNKKSIKPKSEKKNVTPKKIDSKTKKTKKSKKVNVTSEDMDKLCEVYDWYLQVKNVKAITPKPKKSTKDIYIEENNIKKIKSTSIKVDKTVWEEFERLCSNSSFSKQEIITQALKNFMNENKHLL